MENSVLRKYGVETTINFSLFEVDGVDFRIDAVHASGDTKIMKDEGAEANTTNGFTDEGQGYSLVLTATEMEAARIVIYLVDSVTKVWLDRDYVIETYGHPSAQHAMDFDDNAILDALVLQSTTIATLASQVAFTLTTGSTDDDAYNGATIVIIDASTGVQKAFGSISDYVGSTKGVTLAQDPAIFTMAATDKVYILTSDVFAIMDRLLTGSTHNVTNSLAARIRNLQEFGDYDGGAIWIDTVNGSAGTTDYENGTAFNPVDNMADANTLAASLGLSRFQIAPASVITLATSQIGQVFNGNNWTLALGGQDISGTHFFGASAVTGIGTGSSMVDFHDCFTGDCTLPPSHFIACGLGGTITIGSAGDFIFDSCHSHIAGASTPIIDMGAAIGNVNLSMADYQNGIEIQNLNSTGTDLLSISGVGQIIYAASCSGAVEQRGDWKVTNTGGVTITTDDNSTNISSILVDTGTTLPATLATIDAVVDAILIDTDDLQSNQGDWLTAVGFSTHSVADILTTQMTESYAADGVAPTLAQMLFMSWSFYTQMAVVTTTGTAKKLDGSTSAMTFTFNDASDPTSITRAT